MNVHTYVCMYVHMHTCICIGICIGIIYVYAYNTIQHSTSPSLNNHPRSSSPSANNAKPTPRPGAWIRIARPAEAMRKRTPKPAGRPVGAPQAPQGAPGAVEFVTFSPRVGRPCAANSCIVFRLGFAVGVDYSKGHPRPVLSNFA